MAERPLSHPESLNFESYSRRQTSSEDLAMLRKNRVSRLYTEVSIAECAKIRPLPLYGNLEPRAIPRDPEITEQYKLGLETVQEMPNAILEAEYIIDQVQIRDGDLKSRRVKRVINTLKKNILRR